MNYTLEEYLEDTKRHLIRNTLCPAMNEKQMKVAKEICEQEGVDFYKAINHRIF